MTRETSIETYNYIKNNGLLSKRRWQVYDVLYSHGPLTAMEICKHFEGLTEHSITPRMAEMKRQDAVCEKELRACSVTGRNVISWDVTSRVPKKLERVKTSKQVIKELKQEVKRLNAICKVAISAIFNEKSENCISAIKKLELLKNNNYQENQ